MVVKYFYFVFQFFFLFSEVESMFMRIVFDFRCLTDFHVSPNDYMIVYDLFVYLIFLKMCIEYNPILCMFLSKISRSFLNLKIFRCMVARWGKRLSSLNTPWRLTVVFLSLFMLKVSQTRYKKQCLIQVVVHSAPPPPAFEI